MGLELLLFLFPSLMVFWGCRKAWPFWKSRDWVKCSATILSINEKNKSRALSQYQRIKYFYPEITYEYEYEYRKYISKNVGFGIKNIWMSEVDNWGNVKDKTERFWFGWREGVPIDIYVNPFKPEQAVIVNKINIQTRKHCVALCISGFLLFCVLLWLIGRL